LTSIGASSTRIFPVIVSYTITVDVAAPDRRRRGE